MELKEFDEKVIEALEESASVSCTYVQDEVIYDKFLSLLRDIMPPTCTANERKFLDEIREKGEMSGYDFYPNRWMKMRDSEDTTICQGDFETNLRELVNE